MNVQLNGKDATIDCTTIQELWDIEQAERELESSRGFAIALNGALVRKAEWTTTMIKAGDRVEVVRAISGG